MKDNASNKIPINNSNHASVGNASGESLSSVFYIQTATAVNMFPFIHGTSTYINNAGAATLMTFAGARLSAITVDRFQLLSDATLIADGGSISVYGLAKS